MDVIDKKVWVLVVNMDNKYEPLEATIKAVYPGAWNKEHVDYGIEYETVGRLRRIRIPDSRVYFAKWQAEQTANYLNGEY